MKQTKLAALIGLISIVAMNSVVYAAELSQSVPAIIISKPADKNLEPCGQLADGFDFVIDYSSSMYATLKDDIEEQNRLDRKAGKELKMRDDADDPLNDIPKVKLAKDVLQLLNNEIPEMKFTASFLSFAPYTIEGVNGEWNRDLMRENIKKHKENMEGFGRITNLGVGIEKYRQALQDERKDSSEAGVAFNQKMTRAIILVTDGISLRGPDSAETLAKLYEDFPSVTMHFIRLAELEEGQAKLDELQKLKPGLSASADAKNLLKDESAVTAFIEKVFYRECPPPAKKTSPAMEIRGINFAFDKYNIDEKSEKIFE